MGMGKKYYCVAAILWCCALVQAQPFAADTSQAFQKPVVFDKYYSTPFLMGEIYVEGNRRTKAYIIQRELPFKTGDSIYLTDLVKGFEIARQQLFNTGLFNEVVVALKSFRGYYVDVEIKVKERWYIFPIPYLKPVDRNLSEWAKQGFGIDRVNYGFKFTHYNFSGRNDKLRLWLITGYTKQIQFQYEQPFADKTLKHGYRLGFMYSSNKEVNYKTIDNEQVFVDSFGQGLRQWSANIDYIYRPGLRTFNNVRFQITNMRVDTSIVGLNPKYFPGGRNNITFPELQYTLNYYKVDYIHFPLTGWMGEVSFLKRGFSKQMNMWQLSGRATRSWELSKKNYVMWQGYGVIRFPFDQPFVNHRLFGYGELYLRGLENYVIDGVAAFMSRQSYRRELFRFNVPTFLKSKTHDKIPFRIYARAFGDMGYAYNKSFPNNSLVNRMLYTGGLGVDIVTFYDLILRVDYSFNQLGQNGLFLHIKNDL
jgi:outer membrane protein assembly factor BamA